MTNSVFSKDQSIGACIHAGVPPNLLISVAPWDQPIQVTHTLTDGTRKHSWDRQGSGKRPARYSPSINGWVGLYDWRKGHLSERDLRQADLDGANAGLILGTESQGFVVIAIDIDGTDTVRTTSSGKDVVLGAAVSNAFIKAFSDVAGPQLVRKTVGHRALLLVRLPSSETVSSKAVVKLWLQTKDGEARTKEHDPGKIEILASGQQCVVAGTHQSGAPITWYMTDKPNIVHTAPDLSAACKFPDFETLFLVVQETADTLPGVVIETQKMQRTESTPVDLEFLAAPDTDSIVSLLARMSNPEGVSTEDWLRVAFATAASMLGLYDAATPDARVKVRSAFLDWTNRWEGDGSEYQQDEAAIKWDTHITQQSEYKLGWDYLTRFAINLGTPGVAEEQVHRDFESEEWPEGVEAAELPPEKDIKFFESQDAMVAEFNKDNFVVDENGKTLVYRESRVPGTRHTKYTDYSFEHFIKRHLNKFVQVGEKPKKSDKAEKSEGAKEKARLEPVFKPAADIWLRHSKRREMLGGVVFDPSGKTVTPGTLNLWQGFDVTPKAGDWSLMQAHIKDIICSGNEEHYDYLMGWLARLTQRPGEQGEVAVILHSTEEGTGKGTLANAIRRLFGKHGKAISNPKHLVGNFNGHLRDAVFLFADEAFFAGDRAHVGVLKSVITEPYLTFEAKGKDAVVAPNYMHVMMASNEDWVIPAGTEARRFFVLDVSSARIRDWSYFTAIHTQLESGGYEAMLYDLLHMDISAYQVRKVPVTEALRKQRELSLPCAVRWIYDVLYRGWVDPMRPEWLEDVPTGVLYASYKDFAKDAKEYRPLSQAKFGAFLMGLHFEQRRPVVNKVKGPRGYALGDLAKARVAMDDHFKLTTEWPPIDKDEDSKAGYSGKASMDNVVYAAFVQEALEIGA